MDIRNITWNKNNYLEFIGYLERLSEPKYKEFNQKIVNSNYPMLGIRIPELRSIAKKILKGDYLAFLSICSHKYYEEVMIKGFVIAGIKEFSELLPYFNSYVYLIDDWSLCDSFCNSLKILNNYREEFFATLKELLNSPLPFHLRTALVLILNYYLTEDYLPFITETLDRIKSDDYYVNMAEAWLICEMFIKFENVGLNYLANNKLNKFTINKAISKIRDSYRVTEATKKFILKYKQK